MPMAGEKMVGGMAWILHILRCTLGYLLCLFPQFPSKCRKRVPQLILPDFSYMQQNLNDYILVIRYINLHFFQYSLPHPIISLLILLICKLTCAQILFETVFTHIL